MNLPDSLLLLVKYASSVLAAGYGVYATLTDFKEERNGKKILTRKGQWGIALLLVSIVLNVSSDGLKDINEHASANREAHRRNKETANQLAITQSLQTQLQLSQSQIKQLESVNDKLTAEEQHLRKATDAADAALKAAIAAGDQFYPDQVASFWASFKVENTQLAVQRYFERLKRDGAVNSGGIVQFFELEPSSPRYPQSELAPEQELATIIRNAQLVVTLINRKIKIAILDVYKLRG